MRRTTFFEERVGQVLLEAGFVSKGQLDQARRLSQETGSILFDTMISLGLVARETLVTVLSFQLRIPIVDLKTTNIDAEAVRLVPESFARDHHILPVGFDADGSLRIATLMPNDFQLSVQLSVVTGRQIKFALALSGDLDDVIDRTYFDIQPASFHRQPTEAIVSDGLDEKIRIIHEGFENDDIDEFVSWEDIEPVPCKPRVHEGARQVKARSPEGLLNGSKHHELEQVLRENRDLKHLVAELSLKLHRLKRTSTTTHAESDAPEP